MSDLQSGLSLGFHSHTSRAPRTSLADDSISLQIGSSFRDQSHLVPSIPLQLLEQQPQKRGNESAMGREKGEEDEKREEEEFSILGHPMRLKRRRDGESLSSSLSLNPSQSVSTETGLEMRRAAIRAWGNQPLCIADPDIHEIMEKEKLRQFKGIELSASENFVCRAVMEALGSHLTNKYSEGMPGARYYGGNQYIDEMELLCWKRALAAFHLDSENWGVNVQPYSCTSANFSVFTGLLLPNDRIMGLDSPSGGNLSHGYYTPSGKKVSGASIFFESLPYKVNPNTGYIDHDKLEERALDFRPKILICGGSSYPREWDYARFRQIADKCGAVLMCDMAHISGLVAAKMWLIESAWLLVTLNDIWPVAVLHVCWSLWVVGMKQSMCIERKMFDLVEKYAGNVKVLKIHERRRAFPSFIKFKLLLLPWFCDVLVQAVWASNFSAFFRTKDDGVRNVLVKGRVNGQGRFFRVSEILRTGKEFVIIIPEGNNGSGWENVDYVLHRSFRGDGSGEAILSVLCYFLDSFPSLRGVNSSDDCKLFVGNFMVLDVVRREKDWAVNVSRKGGEGVEEVWTHAMLGLKLDPAVDWLVTVESLEVQFGLLDTLQWVCIDSDRALSICPDSHEAAALAGWNCKGMAPCDPEFLRWSPEHVAI